MQAPIFPVLQWFAVIGMPYVEQEALPFPQCDTPSPDAPAPAPAPAPALCLPGAATEGDASIRHPISRIASHRPHTPKHWIRSRNVTRRLAHVSPCARPHMASRMHCNIAAEPNPRPPIRAREMRDNAGAGLAICRCRQDAVSVDGDWRESLAGIGIGVEIRAAEMGRNVAEVNREGREGEGRGKER
jgi:hypothetical protein